jgi:hypothetical protein
MSDRPKRALLSLKSMGVMCVGLAIFVWANIRDCPRDDSTMWTIAREPAWEFDQRLRVSDSESPEVTVSDRGFPWHYRIVVRNLSLGESADAVPDKGKLVGDMIGHVKRVPLLLNLAVALLASITLALASERFVFSRWRRGPHPEAQEEPK